MAQDKAFAFQQQFAVPFSFGQRSYQILELPNGIRGLIITDPAEDVASCCLSVATGHHSNPDNIPGLAHLCEHMVSLSSKDYPQIDSYRKAIQHAGGSSNALTNNESTSFYFSVPISSNSTSTESDFEKILDIFTSNFDQPNFETSYSNREIYSIDNEHAINKSRKNRLAFQGYKILSNKKHPFSRFSTGNFESLTESSKKCDISLKLVEFHQVEYTPNKLSFVLRGPQSLNYLQKLAITKFGKIGSSKNLKNSLAQIKTQITNKTLNSNIFQSSWSSKYKNAAFPKENLGRAILINKNLDSVLRFAFPVCFSDMNSKSKVQFNVFIGYWCELFGSESTRTIASVLFAKDLIANITTKTSTITYDTILLELEISPTEFGLKSISTIIDVIFNFISLFDASNDSKFMKHLSKSMSQFNGIQIYNFLYAEAESQSVLEVQNLSILLLSDIKSYGQFFVRGLSLYDQTIENYKGSYNENSDAKEWWLNEAISYCKFMKTFINLENMLVSLVGDLSKINTDWVLNLPKRYEKENDFDFEYKIGNINPGIINLNNVKDYDLNLSPPNIFADKIVDNQSKLLEISEQTILNSKNASLGYSVKNISLNEIPKLFHHDEGCQLWIKTEVDNIFKNKIMLTLELINIKLEPSPTYVTMMEILVQLVKFRVNAYLYPALTLNYVYDLFPSFKGDNGILLHVSGPRENFSKVLMVLIYEIKLIVDNFENSVTTKEFERAKMAVLLKYEIGNNLSSLEASSLGLLATMEQDTWLLEQRLASCKHITMENISPILPKLFQSCYLSVFLQGDINSASLKNDILPIITKLVDKFEGEGHKFPSTVYLPAGSNYFVHSTTKDATNGIEYFIQTCKRDNIYNKSITKFISFLMSISLAAKIRTEYQLGYIVLVGLRTLRKSQGIHISVVSAGYTSNELESKLEDLLMEWYEQNIKKMNKLQLSELVDKFIATETTNGKSETINGNSNILFGAMGNSLANKKIIKQHNNYWEQIENKTFSFSNNSQGEDSIDFTLIKKITIEQFNEFIKLKVLPTSNERSKISVQIDSNCPEGEIEKNNKGIQLILFLSSCGLPIKPEHLEDILTKSGDSQVVLCKNLYKYYREKGKSIKLIAAAMAKLSTSYIFSNSDTTIKVESAIPKVEIGINNLREWQQKIGYITDEIPMKERLNGF